MAYGSFIVLLSQLSSPYGVAAVDSVHQEEGFGGTRDATGNRPLFLLGLSPLYHFPDSSAASMDCRPVHEGFSRLGSSGNAKSNGFHHGIFIPRRFSLAPRCHYGTHPDVCFPLCPATVLVFAPTGDRADDRDHISTASLCRRPSGGSAPCCSGSQVFSRLGTTVGGISGPFEAHVQGLKF